MYFPNKNIAEALIVEIEYFFFKGVIVLGVKMAI